MKPQQKIYFLLLFGIFFLHFLSADITIPKIVPYVNDFANTMSPNQVNNLNLMADAIEKNSTYEIAIVTVPDTQGMDRIEFANEIGDQNGVGKKELSNGVVVLWSMSNQEGGAIATGRGSETIFNDALVGRIGRDAVDFFNNGSYYQGFVVIMTELDARIIETNGSVVNASSSSNSTNQNSNLNWLALLIPFVFIFILLIRNIFDDSDSDSDSDDSDNSEEEDTEKEKTYERYYPKRFVKKHNLKKVKGKWYKKKKGNQLDYVSPVMMAYLFGLWSSSSSSSNSSSSYSPSYSSGWGSSSSSSSSGGGFSGGSFGGGSFGGGGASFGGR